MVKHVCHKCVNDVVLGEVVLAQATSVTCSYCRRNGRGSLIAAELDVLISYLSEIIQRDYTEDLDSEIAWDHEERRYIEGVLEIDDVVDNLGFQPLRDKLLYDVLARMSGTSYARIGHYPGTISERAINSWEYFCETVTHLRRFTFWDDEPDGWNYHYSPAKLLEEIMNSVVRGNLVKTLAVGASFWRVRIHDARSNPLVHDEDFTSVPVEWATAANRMSPAGIPMFYGACDFMTACKEVVGLHHADKKNRRVTGMKFEVIQSLNVLDLTSIPQPRSLFEMRNHFEWHDMKFLIQFVGDLSRPIDKSAGSGRPHIDYVPTQVFTEAVRYRMRHCGQPVHGILYPSCHDGKPCAVIFATQDECLPASGSHQLLEAVKVSRRHVPVSVVKKALKKRP